MEANALAGPDTIVLAAGAAYTLDPDDDTTPGHANEPAIPEAEDDLDIRSKITIQGNNATIERTTAATCDLNFIEVTGEFRIFEVESGGDLTLQNVTVQNGCADGTPLLLHSFGGGITNGGTVNIKNSIVGNNTASLGPNCSLVGGTFTASGVNFATDTSCTGFTQVTPAQLNLGPLAVNAPGTTATHALLVGSVAIDAVPLGQCTDVGNNPVTQDQRGVSRPQGARCDSGAYEANPARTLTVQTTGSGSGTVTDNFSQINCGGTCTASYGNGATVTLTAAPNSGSTFAGWSGHTDCTDGSVTMNAGKTCTAKFNLTVSCSGVQVSVRPTRKTFFHPTARRPDARKFSVTVWNNSRGPVTVNDITLRPDKFDATYTLVQISPTLPQTVLRWRSRTFTVVVRKAAGTPAQTVNAPFFNVQMSCGMLPASEQLIPLRVEGLQVEQHAGQVRVAALGEGIASIGLELFDLSGRRLLTQRGEGRVLTVAVNGLANGVYLYVVRVRGFDGREHVSEVRKLVILR